MLRTIRASQNMMSISQMASYSPGHIQVARHPEGWVLVDFDAENEKYEIIAGPYESRHAARFEVRFYEFLASYGGSLSEDCLGRGPGWWKCGKDADPA